MTTETRGAPTAGTRAGAPGSRLLALDGLRGVTIVLVVLGHLSAFLWPVEGIRSTPWLRGLVAGGAVPIFFVVSGYIVTAGLLREDERGTLDPVRFYARRLVRLGAQVVPLCAAVVLVAALDPTDTAPAGSTVTTVTHTLTYTNNWLYALDPLQARPDLGHLWFLSVQQQWYLVLPLAVAALAARRRVLTWVLVLLAVASATYRLVEVSDATWFGLSVGTFARADGLLLGAALAVALPALRRLAPRASVVGTLLLVAVPVLLSVGGELGPYAYLEDWSVAFVLVAAGLVAAVVLHERESGLTRALSARWLTWLGRASLVVYVWHYPVIFFVGRHVGPDASPVVTTAVVLSVVGVITVVSHRWVEEPVRRWLATHLRPAPTDRPLPPAPGVGVA
ncbi:acyltransferase [Arthrobacter sp. NEB 688]|uniref:acyltransferase family protein n=1 Tax=Arthrobacter sp. NEB 688 TaxID=904039 RepID=UPI00156307E3|nr:acyltransferase [Arthrobacter sp. NEB 688]QKE84881.1 acyltransferase [Arthrobacter sp. NEB 688]